MRFAVVLGVVVLIAACSGSHQSNSGASPAPSANGMSTPSYTDMDNVSGSIEIGQLAQLGVFESTSGAFSPNDPITRGEFARWLVMANNALWANDPSKQIPLSHASVSAYPDVATTHPDYPYIQGLYDAGFALGFEDKTFRPDDTLTREQMIAMKENVDRGGVEDYYVAHWDSGISYWTDRMQIDPPYRGAIAEDSGFDLQNPNFGIENVGRTWGALTLFQPTATVTRRDAAMCLWRIGAHTDKTDPADVPRTAEDALPQSPQPSPAPT
jgi:hypothetical protein